MKKLADINELLIRPIIKETECFVVNLPTPEFKKKWALLGSKSGRDIDKFKAADIKWTDGDVVNAPILTECPVNIECRVVEHLMPKNGSNDLFIGLVEAVHVDEEYLNANGKIKWTGLDIIHW